MARGQNKPPDEPSGLEGSIRSMIEARDAVELVVELRNHDDRTLHYIADARAILIDPATGTVRVQMSDRGREMPPGGIAMTPRFRSIDPHSQAVLTVRLPKTIVRLSSTPSPPGETRFEELAITDATNVELEIGWADVPYYRDPRASTEGTSPVSSWEKQSLSISRELPSKKK
jgi:hypothetical protein